MKKRNMYRSFLAVLLMAFMISACGNTKKDKPSSGFNLFPVEKDVELGAQVAREIESKPNEYPVLDSASNVAAYRYIYEIRNRILATGEVEHKDDFVWRIRIIQDDEILNAFCTPGGYIYFYTGIIKYLENEAQLAGVMGHEMAHADLRHSTRQMSKNFGVQLLLSAVLGDQKAIGQITGGLINLQFSRGHETEADHMSVHYLCCTKWPGDSGAGFFEKIQESGAQSPPEFLSTHPSPDNRIENYHKWAQEDSCQGDQLYINNYEAFKSLF
ncbi:MAG: M48 family metalloprotease [Crocinitomicaceae bacterium]